MESQHLPAEILEQIFQYIPIGFHGQLDHYSICLVSRSWYSSAIRRLYHSPSVIGKNFDAFAKTLTPSINPHIRRMELAFFVHRLDMSRLVYSGSKSLTARVLGRVKEQLEVFIAPAATFSLLAFSALSKCHKLRILDLDYVIEKIDAVQLLRTVGKLHDLEKLSLRMAWVAPADSFKSKKDLSFPSSLRKLSISGICESQAAVLLYGAMGTSSINTLWVTLGAEGQRELSSAIYRLKLKRLHIDIGPRPTSPDWHSTLSILLPDILYNAREVEELSIPLFCLDCAFFTEAGLVLEPTYALRRLIIHPSPLEITWPMLQNYQWDQFIINIRCGHLQYLKEITVLDRKEVAKFVEADAQSPDVLEALDQALFDEKLQRSGLFLTGHEEYS